MISRLLLSACVVLAAAGNVFAAHPLITDDAGTQGKGRFQLELNGEYGHENEDGATAAAAALAGILSYGAADNLDLVFSVPFQSVRTESGDTITENGISDVSIELKWRFFDNEGLSLGLKPGITFPTGDEEKGLGTGKPTYSLYFIATKELKPWVFHLNLGYIRNENKGDERKDLWHVSSAAEVEVMKDLRLVGNIGIQSNTDGTSDTPPSFILGGVIYSISENLDIDFGVKRGLTAPETDYSLLTGVSWRF